MSWPKELRFQLLGPFPMSFETGEQTATKIYANHRLRITKVRSIVRKALSATDAGTITVASTAGTMATISHPASSALNSEQSADADTTKNLIAKGGYLTVTAAKTTVGGKVLVTIEAEREI